MGDMLQAGQFGLIIVAVNPKGTDVGNLLTHASSKHVIDGVHDTDGAIESAFEATEA